MVARLKRDSVASELRAVSSMIDGLDADDKIGRRSLSYRRDELARELDLLEERVDTVGRVILAFEGGPVVGSRGIDATFASRTLGDYQELIAKQLASDDAELASRGPVPARNSARLNITNVVHGSFGFELEERGVDQFGLIDSPVKMAIAAIDDVLVAFAGPSEATFQAALANVDRRVFLSAQSFFDNLYRDSASLKIIESDRDFLIDQYAVISARDRIAGAVVVDAEISVFGELLGLTPVSRRFDFRVTRADGIDPDTIISGQVGQRLSDDYLERVHGEERISGRMYIASMSRRSVRRADGTQSVSYSLLDLDVLAEEPGLILPRQP